MVYRVKEAFSFDDGGVPITLRAGTLLEEDDPRIRGRERYLERAEAAAARTSHATETATAVPGERRSLGDLDSLREQATNLGIKVDGRWNPDRLRQEIAKKQ